MTISNLTPTGADRYNLIMKRSAGKRGSEKPKKPRHSSGLSSKHSKHHSERPERPERLERKMSRSHPEKKQDICRNCHRLLGRADRVLFVEEEIGRVFCSEECISHYFTPEVEKLEKDYLRRVSPADLGEEEKEKFSNLRWVTLQEPDEVWREKTLAGDYRYTLISQFKPHQKAVWSVCICLCLKSEPSFLYLSFVTRDGELARHYRKGERIPWTQVIQQSPDLYVGEGKTPTGPDFSQPTDGLAEAWTEEETLRAQLMRGRQVDDIPLEEFVLYQSFAEESLQSPDEVWSIETKGENSLRLYHFMKEYPDEQPGIWYIVVARETEDQDQIEILDAFPTRDMNLVDLFRRGQQEIGRTEPTMTATRLVH